LGRLSYKILLATALFLVTFSSALAGGRTPVRTGGYAEGEVLVKFRADVSAASLEEAGAALGAVRVREFKRLGLHHLRLPAGFPVDEAVGMFRAHPDVEYAEPNYILRMNATPDDPYYSYIWALNNIGQTVEGVSGAWDADIDAPEAWDTTTGSDSVLIAVMDSGIDYNHPDISPNMWQNPLETAGNDLDDDGNGYVDDVWGWDFFSGDSDPMDDVGHGTHVAGIIAAKGNNGTGSVGVNWTAKIMALKFLDINGMGYTSDVISAIEYASNEGAHVINCSFGGSNYSQALKDAIDASPALFVCAAGNTGSDNDAWNEYPAGFESSNILAVAASDQDDNLAYFSNYGATSVDVAAPGSNILSSITAPRPGEWFDDFEDADISDWSTDAAGSWTVENGALSDGPGDYQNNADKWVRQELFLSGKKGCGIEYTLTLQMEEGFDFLYLETSTDLISWSTVQYHTGVLSGEYTSSSLPSSGSGTLYVRFRLTSDGTITSGGAYIDNVAVTCASENYDGSSEYSYQSGTSMAAPMASGVAGLIKAQNPQMTGIEIKERIISSVDALASLDGLLLSGGRINAANSLLAAPGNVLAQAVSKSQIDLAWTDKSATELGFVIERKSTDAYFGGATEDFASVAWVHSNVTYYSDTGLRSGTTYTYRVKAYTDTNVSANSNESSAETLSSDDGGGGGGGLCFIATAAYGSRLAPEVQALRDFRDRHLLKSRLGRGLVSRYYKYSPPLADYISRRPGARFLARLALAPVVFGVRHPGVAAGSGAAAVFLLALSLAYYEGKRFRKGKND
jgi:subtilisin family serine protease